MNKEKGFTLVELLVVIAIIGILSAVVLFSITQYINKSKDANVIGNLAILISAGEVYYNGNQTYAGFCSSSIVTNSEEEMPRNINSDCYDGDNYTSTGNPAGICCFEDVENDAWAACALEFFDSNRAYCVDSRGVKKEVDKEDCVVGGIIDVNNRCP